LQTTDEDEIQHRHISLRYDLGHRSDDIGIGSFAEKCENDQLDEGQAPWESVRLTTGNRWRKPDDIRGSTV